MSQNLLLEHSDEHYVPVLSPSKSSEGCSRLEICRKRLTMTSTAWEIYLIDHEQALRICEDSSLWESDPELLLILDNWHILLLDFASCETEQPYAGHDQPYAFTRLLILISECHRRIHNVMMARTCIPRLIGPATKEWLDTGVPAPLTDVALARMIIIYLRWAKFGAWLEDVARSDPTATDERKVTFDFNTKKMDIECVHRKDPIYMDVYQACFPLHELFPDYKDPLIFDGCNLQTAYRRDPLKLFGHWQEAIDMFEEERRLNDLREAAHTPGESKDEDEDEEESKDEDGEGDEEDDGEDDGEDDEEDAYWEVSSEDDSSSQDSDEERLDGCPWLTERACSAF